MTIKKSTGCMNGACVRSHTVESALCYLMSRFAVQRCYWVAKAVQHHLEILIDPAETKLPSAKRALYTQLLSSWQTIASAMETSPPNSPVLRSIHRSPPARQW
jgi:hypothetical protein